MAKSLRSKTKRSFRQKKRETGEYAAAAAGRLHRLNSKLLQLTKKDANQDVNTAEVEGDDDDVPESMVVDAEPSSTHMSTHGPRGSRREEWRKSKGMPARATANGMNRQGGIAAKRKAGRSKRRR
ncbi:hypothetical protein CVT25_011171 [Psilocybe cyanescens]|uniref:DUF2423 domain-containing protein n=1 Tax=Psilocybe cyanescens TaxID=93625 RepID=A0A409WGU0_PSICY|nr:hypothetical protein CVT25_011171 [Psilocybe cyanescens]